MKNILLTLFALLAAISPLCAQEKRIEMDNATKKATAKALEWLKSKQNADGSFSDGAYGNNTGITSFALLAFMSQGHLPDKEEFGPEVAKAARFLVASQRAQDGYILGSRGGNMYCHAMATLALAELCGQTGDDRLKPVIRKAVDLIIRCQAVSGGWRYEPQPTGADCSITIAQVMALQSAKNAGFLVPDITLKKAVEYVKTCNRLSDGGFTYMPRGSTSTFANTAGALCVFQSTGEKGGIEISKSIGFLKARFDSPTHFFYGHYYAAQAMHQAGGKDWEEWYSKLVKQFVDAKTQDQSGAWTNLTRRELGPVFQTSIAVICLSMPATYPKKYKPIDEKKEGVEKKADEPVKTLAQAADRLEKIAADQFELYLQSRSSIRDLEIAAKPDLSPTLRLLIIKRNRSAGTAFKQQSDKQLGIEDALKKVLKETNEFTKTLSAEQKDNLATADRYIAETRLYDTLNDAVKKLRTLGYPDARLKQFRLGNEQQRLAANQFQDVVAILRTNEDKTAALKSTREILQKAIPLQDTLVKEIRDIVALNANKQKSPDKVDPKKTDAKLVFPDLQPLPKISPATQKRAELEKILRDVADAESNLTLSDKQSRLAFEIHAVAKRLKLHAPEAATALDSAVKAMTVAAENLFKNDPEKATDLAAKATTSLREALHKSMGQWK